jgi:fatty-acyl-CoA synthase
MQERIEHLAALLHSQGIGKGDRVAFLTFNCPDFLFALFATASLGAIFVPLNFRLTAAELEFLICDAGVHTLFVGPEHAPLIEGIRPKLPCRNFIQLGNGGVDWPQLDALLAKPLPPAPLVEVHADDVATIVYTSGTTGLPKGAMLTHANLWANNLNWILAFGIGPQDVLLTTAPMFHVSGIFVLLAPILLVGAHVILHRGFEAGAVIKAVSDHRVTMSMKIVDAAGRQVTYSISSSMRLSIGSSPRSRTWIGCRSASGPVIDAFSEPRTRSTLACRSSSPTQ